MRLSIVPRLLYRGRGRTLRPWLPSRTGIGLKPPVLARLRAKGLSMPSVYSLLYQAIEEKKQVIAMYDGYLREMCPHVLGSKDGVSMYSHFNSLGQ